MALWWVHLKSWRASFTAMFIIFLEGKRAAVGKSRVALTVRGNRTSVLHLSVVPQTSRVLPPSPSEEQ